MSKSPVWTRIYFCDWYCALVRAPRYDGLPDPKFWDLYKELAASHGNQKLSDAYKEICRVDRSTKPATIRLTDECLHYSKPLIGEPPAQDEQPKQESKELTVPKPKITPEAAAENVKGSVSQRLVNILQSARENVYRGSDVEESRIWLTAAEEELKRQGVEVSPPEYNKPDRRKPQEENPYARQAKEKNVRSLMVMLRDARRALAHHGKTSHAGREARKQIAAAEGEINNRGYAIPVEGEQTKRWDRK